MEQLAHARNAKSETIHLRLYFSVCALFAHIPILISAFNYKFVLDFTLFIERKYI